MFEPTDPSTSTWSSSKIAWFICLRTFSLALAEVEPRLLARERARCRFALKFLPVDLD